MASLTLGARAVHCDLRSLQPQFRGTSPVAGRSPSTGKEFVMSMSAETRPTKAPQPIGRHELIGSDRVEGTNVYRSDGTKIGEIERVMIDKLSGQAAYAVMGFGGFLGLGEDHYPIPWQRLTYNAKLGGYEVNLTESQLKNAPHYATGEEWKWDATQGRTIYDYYGVAPYWPM
jgi:sporulation protein YlmC with PRC-barrel domain